MTTVPCSVEGCGGEGSRWVFESYRYMRPFYVRQPKWLRIPRFVCSEHAEKFAKDGKL